MPGPNQMAYVARLMSQGWRRLTVMLDPEACKALDKLTASGKSANAAISAAVVECAGRLSARKPRSGD